MSDAGESPHITQLNAVLDAAAEIPAWSLSDTQLIDQITAAHALLSRVEGILLLPAIREADTRGLATTSLDAPSTADWLHQWLRMRMSQAKQLVELAHAVDTDVPAVGAALAAGQISRDHAQAIAHSVAALPAEVASWVPAAAETQLIEHARELDPYKVAKLGRHILQVVDPDHGDELLRAQLEREEQQAVENRRLHVTAAGPGQVRLSDCLDAEGWHTVRTALDPLAVPRPALDGDRDARDHGRRMADALVELADRALVQGELPANGGERPTVVVTLDYAKLAAQVGTGALDSGEPLSAATVRRLACDAKIIPAVLGGPSVCLDVGRAQRTFTGPLRRALVLRDGGCAFPGCDRPAQWCDGHHLLHWADGGQTCLANGVLLCGQHHHQIHHSGWTVRIAADGLPEFTPPPWVDPHQRPRRHHRHRATHPPPNQTAA